MAHVVHRRDPRRVVLTKDELDDRGRLQLEVQTADLGADNDAGVHVYDRDGHVHDVDLAWEKKRGREDVFTGSIGIEELKRRGFDVAHLQQQPFVAYAAGTRVLWGESKGYDAKRYRERVDEHVWRGSSIDDAADLEALLRDQQPRLIVVLRRRRERHYNADEALIGQANMNRPGDRHVKLVRIPVRDFHAPTLDQVKQFLDLVTDPANQPAYVHCRAGIGRTGVMIAAYRMAVNGWTCEAALEEARGFGLSDGEQVAFIHEVARALEDGRIPRYGR